MTEARNNDGTVRTRTQLARDVYEEAERAAMAAYQAVIRDEFKPGTKVSWKLRIGKPDMTGEVIGLPRFEFSDKVSVKARTGTVYEVEAWYLNRATDGVTAVHRETFQAQPPTVDGAARNGSPSRGHE